MNNIATSSFTLLAIMIALLLAFFLLALKTDRKLSNRLFATFLILSAIDISGLIPFPASLGLNKLEVFRSMLIFLHLPVFFWYVKSVCYSDFEIKMRDWVHILPFVLITLLLIPTYFFPIISTTFTAQLFSFILLLFHIQVAVYLWSSFTVLQKFKVSYINNFAGEQLEAYQWLFRLIVALAIFYSLALIKNFFKFNESQELSETLRLVLLFFELFVLCWYLFQAISRPEIFRGILSKLSLENVGSANVDTSKINYLEKVMSSEKLFLDPAISIKDVAEKIDMTPRDLSTLLNRHMGKHFFDFINEYRISEAQEILKTSEDAKLTILEVLYQVGFNSKSSFNTAFKKHTGTTPTIYRKSL